MVRTAHFRSHEVFRGDLKLIDHVPHKEAISLKNQSAREIQNAPVLVKQ